MSEQIIFVVHTDSYSGNFERDLCAYITGQIGECGVGDDMARDFIEDEGDETAELFGEIVNQVQDENGIWRPCEIYPTPGRLNNGMGKNFDAKEGEIGYPAYESVAIYFNQRPSDEQILLMKARTAKYTVNKYNRESYHANREPLIVKGFELITEITEKKVARETI